MELDQDRYIPASSLTARLARIRSRIAALTQQTEDLRREEKLVASILEDAVATVAAAHFTPLRPVVAAKFPPPPPARADRAKGVVEGIIGLIQSKPGITRGDLVDGLKHLNLNPFDPNAARRTILNNLGNQLRSGRIREDESTGQLFLVEGDPAAGG